MLLALDIGNTNTTVGLFDGDTLKGSWRIQSDREKTADEYGILLNQLLAYRGIDPHGITTVAIACVLPPVLPAWERVAQSYFGVKPLIISYELEHGPGHPLPAPEGRRRGPYRQRGSGQGQVPAPRHRGRLGNRDHL